VLREHVDPQTLHVGFGLLADHLDGVVVNDLGLLDALGVGRVGGEVLVDDDVVAEGDVLGRDRLSVLPLDALADLERPHEAVVGHRPALGKPRLRITFGVVADEHVVVERPHLVGRGLVADERVEVVRVVGPAQTKRDLVARRRSARIGGQRRAEPPDEARRKKTANGEQKQASRDVVPAPWRTYADGRCDGSRHVVPSLPPRRPAAAARCAGHGQGQGERH